MLHQLLLLFAVSFPCSCHVRVVGNLAIVARPIGHVGTDDAPLQSNIGVFWCGIEKVSEEVPVHHGEFRRLRDGKVFEASISDRKAKLHFGKSPATVAGKYTCELRGDDGKLLKGNLIIYSPPVLRLPTGSMFYEVPGARPPTVKGGVKKIREGDKAVLLCPAFAYPEPFIRWEKDGKAVEPSASVSYDGDDLIITNARTAMSGIYTCIADNSFPLFVDGPSMPHQLIYEQELTVVS